MELDKIIEKRKSARSFKSKKVPLNKVVLALDAGLQAPFAGNIGHLYFLVTEDSEKINKIASYCQQTWMTESNIVVLVCSNDIQLETAYGERGRIYSRQQAGAAIENILLKLTEQGLSSCWVGSYSDELVKQTMQIPEHIQIEAILPIGYENKVPGSDKKKKPELYNCLFWEIWDSMKRPTIFKEAPRDKDPWS